MILCGCRTLTCITVRPVNRLHLLQKVCPAMQGYSASRQTPLVFRYLLPATGRIRDFAPLEMCAAGRTTKKHTCTHRTGVLYRFIIVIRCFYGSCYDEDSFVYTAGLRFFCDRFSRCFFLSEVYDSTCRTLLGTQTTVLALVVVDLCKIVFDSDSIELASLFAFSASDTSD